MTGHATSGSETLSLGHTWTFWTSKWKGKQNLQFVSRFDTVQSFWSNFKAVSPSSLPDKSYLHMFKDGIAPLWEDPQNVAGGHFKLTALTPESSQAMWQTVALHLIGELLPVADYITGVSIVVHQIGNNLLKVWLCTADKEAVSRTRMVLADILSSADYIADKMTFVPHKLVLPGGNQKACKKQEDEVGSSLEVHNEGTSAEIGTKKLKKNEKRRKSTESSDSSNSTPTQPPRKASFRLAVNKASGPVCCGPSQVRFAHDPYSLMGGCTYISVATL